MGLPLEFLLEPVLFSQESRTRASLNPPRRMQVSQTHPRAEGSLNHPGF